MGSRDLPTTPAAAPSGRLDAGQNFGAMTRTLESGDLLVNAADHTPGMVVPPHVHANSYLCVVVAGSFELQERRSHDCGAGSVVAYPAGHRHANRFSDQPGRCVNIHLGPSWVAQRALRDWLADCRHVALGSGSAAWRGLAREMSASDDAAALAATSAAIEVLAEAMRIGPVPQEPRWAARIVDLIEADLAGAPGLSRIALELGVHPAHASRVFRQAFGETVGEYVRRRRVEQADHALIHGTLSLAEIAAAAGFADQAHFTRVYRRRFGMSPGARRRAMQRSF